MPIGRASAHLGRYWRRAQGNGCELGGSIRNRGLATFSLAAWHANREAGAVLPWNGSQQDPKS